MTNGGETEEPKNVYNQNAGYQSPSRPRKVAIIGSGVSGLGAAYLLTRDDAGETNPVQVTVYEASAKAGGHANTVHVSL